MLEGGIGGGHAWLTMKCVHEILVPRDNKNLLADVTAVSPFLAPLRPIERAAVAWLDLL